MLHAAHPLASMRLLIWCAAPALATAESDASSPTSSIALAGALTAQTSGGSIIRVRVAVGDAHYGRNVTTFELQLRVQARGTTDRLTVAIHDGIGGPGSYHGRPVHGPLILHVYLADSVPESATNTIAAALRAVRGVVTVRYESKDEGAAEAAANNPDIASALATLGTNPLPASLVVSLADTRTIPTIVMMAAASPQRDASLPQSPGIFDNFSASATTDPRGIGEIALYTPEAHATGTRERNWTTRAKVR